MTGRTYSFGVPKSPVQPPAGSQCRLTEKIRISQIATTNDGRTSPSVAPKETA